ncbi:Retrovirus-related Pol polyprotein from transposon TNT 1-94 [Apostasia shenzhenica]|uniref:Retrovirus-related Pol polyprotein from transposon TNT 1-94 n=1 Tax=Apostasia shenzhenica TaxID=1088818 RepID=A0A2I0A7Y7_9ASPA|nr:Retrovirus-related Pol polyprotein from transposon TNT 1-94 [Apostasia shenzhenica]
MIKQGDSSIDDYMQSVKNIINNLGAIGHSVTEPDILMHILAGLNATYDSLVPTITIRVDDFSVEEVHGILSSHERLLQLKSTQSTDTSFPSINTAGRSHSSSSSFNRGGRGGRGGRGRGRSRGKGRCQICLMPGHYAHECYKRFDQRFIGGLNSMNRDGSYAATQPLTSHGTTHARAYHSAITQGDNRRKKGTFPPFFFFFPLYQKWLNNYGELIYLPLFKYYAEKFIINFKC